MVPNVDPGNENFWAAGVFVVFEEAAESKGLEGVVAGADVPAPKPKVVFLSSLDGVVADLPAVEELGGNAYVAAVDVVPNTDVPGVPDGVAGFGGPKENFNADPVSVDEVPEVALMAVVALSAGFENANSGGGTDVGVDVDAGVELASALPGGGAMRENRESPEPAGLLVCAELVA